MLISNVLSWVHNINRFFCFYKQYAIQVRYKMEILSCSGTMNNSNDESAAYFDTMCIWNIYGIHSSVLYLYIEDVLTDKYILRVLYICRYLRNFKEYKEQKQFPFIKVVYFKINISILEQFKFFFKWFTLSAVPWSSIFLKYGTLLKDHNSFCRLLYNAVLN